MSALAQFQVMPGGPRAAATARSTAASAASARPARAARHRGACRRTAAASAGDCAALVVSTAVEDQVPDVAAARARGIPIIHRSELLAHFVAALPHDRGHRHQRQVDGGGDDVRDPARRRPRSVGDHRRRSARAPGAGPVGQRLGRRLGPARGRGRRERRLAGALRARDRRGAQPAARPQGDDRGRGDVRDVPRPHARGARRRRGREPRPARRRRARFGFGPRADVRGEDVELGPGVEPRSTSRDARSRCRCPGAHNVENALAAIAACRALGVPLAEMVGAARALPRRRAALPDASARRAASRWSTTSRTIAGRSPPRSRTAQLRARAACSRSTSRTATGRRASCAATSSTTFARDARRPTTGCGCSRCSTPAAPRRATSRPPTSWPRSRARRRAPSSRRRATGSWRASPRRRGRAIWCW